MNTSPPSRRERREADAAGPTRGPGRAGRRRPVEKPDGTPPAPAPDQVAGASQDTGASQPPASRAARKQPAAGPGRAGRNLPAAIGVGVGLGAVIVASLFIRKEAFLAVAVLAVCTGVWELSHGLSAGRIRVPLLPSVVGAATMVVAAYKGGGQALTVAFGLTCVAVLLWRVADGLDDAMRDIAGGIFVAAYVPLLAGFASLMLA
ncbi:MAG: hypothetical protein ACXVYU_18055 [Oryzihumus sp.]